MKLKFCILIPVLCALTNSVYSQVDTLIASERQRLTEEDLQKVLHQEQEIVSASRSTKKVEDLPMTIYIVSREEIIRNNYITLVDVLKTLPGIRVSQPGSGEAGDVFSMRGLEGNSYAKILINGIPIKPSVVRGMPISAQIPIRQAERIEIIYGPASSIYGADATNGVINIVTRSVNKTLFSQADASIGTNGYSYFNFMVGGKAGKNKKTFDYTLFGNSYSWKNMNITQDDYSVYRPLSYYSISNQPIDLNGTTYQPYELTDELLNEIDPAASQFFYAHLPENYKGTLTKPKFAKISEGSQMFGLMLSHRKFNLGYLRMDRYSHSSIGLTSYLYNYYDPATTWGETIDRLSLGYETDFNNLHCATNVFYISYRIRDNSSKGVGYLASTDKVYFYSASDDLYAEQLFTWSRKKNFEVILGGSMQYSGNLPLTNDLVEPFDTDLYKPFSTSVNYNDSVFGKFGINPITFTNVAGFFQVYYQWRKFTLIGGVRFDENQEYGSSTTPRMAVLYKLNGKNSLRLTTGQAFKAPSASRAYQSIAISDFDGADAEHEVSYEVIPNPGLKPELFHSFEFGYRKYFDHGSIDISLYNNVVEEPISGTGVPVDPSIYPYAADGDSARQYRNSTEAESQLFGLQSTVRFFNIVPSIKLNADINLHFADGYEHLPGNDSISLYREMPRFMGVVNISLEPFENFYFRMTSRLVSPWYRRYGVTAVDFENPYSKVDGYHVMDLLVSYTFGKNLTGFINAKNVFDERYGGIDNSGFDIDLRYNPQPGRNFRFGITYTWN